jgi:protein-S-isoprenylcysteine O-methyltransferase Ste14
VAEPERSPQVAVVARPAIGAHNLAVTEERYLEAKFGDEYRESRSRVALDLASR